MKILLISHSIIEYDGRLRELIKVCKSIGDTINVSRSISDQEPADSNHRIFRATGWANYLRFIIFCIKIAMRMGRIDVVFADNRMAIFPAVLIKFLFGIKSAIYDARELYIISEVKFFRGKTGCVFEKIFIKCFNIIICANSFRSQIMQVYFKLKNKPIVYENLRKLSISFNKYKEISDKYLNLFCPSTINIVSTSGCSISRTNDVLAKAVCRLGNRYALYLVGNSSTSDLNEIEKIKKDNNFEKIIVIGNVSEGELKYILGQCHIGIVNYHQNDTNNKYCASGKLYEYLFEGLPVVTTENPPLVDLCLKYGIGVSDNLYYNGILEISNNLEVFKSNVHKYTSTISVDENNLNLKNDILSSLNKF